MPYNKAYRLQCYKIVFLLLSLFMVQEAFFKYHYHASTLNNISGNTLPTFEAVSSSSHYEVKENSYASNYNERVEQVKGYLYSKGLHDSEVSNFLRIIARESQYNDKVEPLTDVKYCSGGGFTELGQCTTEVISAEKSFGLLQILPSTAKGAGCEGFNVWDVNGVTRINSWLWDKQLDCGVKLYRITSFTPWATY